MERVKLNVGWELPPRTKPRVSVPLMADYKIKGYDVAERIKKYKLMIEGK